MEEPARPREVATPGVTAADYLAAAQVTAELIQCCKEPDVRWWYEFGPWKRPYCYYCGLWFGLYIEESQDEYTERRAAGYVQNYAGTGT